MFQDEERSYVIPGAEVKQEENLWTIVGEITSEARDIILFEATKTGKPYSLLEDTFESLVIQFFSSILSTKENQNV